MFGGKDNFKLLSNIDRKTAVTAVKVEQLAKQVEDNKHTDGTWQSRVEAAIQVCPESAHIKTQNGKIDDMTITLKAVKMLTKIILGVGTVLAIILGYLQWAKSAEELFATEQEPVFVGKSWEDCAEYTGIVLEERYYQLDTEHYIHHSNTKVSHAMVFNKDNLFMFLIKGNYGVWIAIGEVSKDSNQRWLLFKVYKDFPDNVFTMLYMEMLEELSELAGSNHGLNLQIMFGESRWRDSHLRVH
tara:strand:+ start:3045 stop:3773 length:729 start_codon:yes stop_codon:yes gene_type:complete